MDPTEPELSPLTDDESGQAQSDCADRRDTVEQMAKWALLAPLMTVLFDPERAAAGAESAVF